MNKNKLENISLRFRLFYETGMRVLAEYLASGER